MLMGYMLPLRFIKVAQKTSDNNQCDVAICATRIVAIMSTETYQARQTIKAEKRAGTLVNAAGRNAVKSAIFLDNGTVIASPLTVNRQLTAIEKSNFKEAGAKRTNETVRIKVYDVADEEPNAELDEDQPEVTVEDGDFDYEGDLEEIFLDEDEEIAEEE